MLINIPMKIHDLRSNIILVTCDINLKLHIFTNSKAICLPQQKKAINFDLGTDGPTDRQLQSNIPFEGGHDNSLIAWKFHQNDQVVSE
jgi:hypothetical protein